MLAALEHQNKLKRDTAKVKADEETIMDRIEIRKIIKECLLTLSYVIFVWRTE